MKFVKLTAAAALVAASFAASAMSSISDDELSAVSGQDGVTIAGDLNINIGSFQYKDTDTTGGSVNFNGIKINGMFIMTVDILSAGLTATPGVYAAGSFADAVSVAMQGHGLTAAEAAGQIGNLVAYGAYGTAAGQAQDVVQFAFPYANVDQRLTPSISVASIKMGSTSETTLAHTDNSSPSFGSMSINNIDMQGTKIWMYAH